MSSDATIIWSRLPDTTPHRVTLGEYTFHCVVKKRQTAVYINVPEFSLGGRETSGGRVTSPRKVG